MANRFKEKEKKSAEIKEFAEKRKITSVESDNTTQIHNTDTQHTYTIQKEETRSQRVQIVIKPSVNEKLDKLVKQKVIKSKNDLVNFLLENWLNENK